VSGALELLTRPNLAGGKQLIGTGNYWNQNVGRNIQERKHGG
jgi:hypothetical protein